MTNQYDYTVIALKQARWQIKAMDCESKNAATVPTVELIEAALSRIEAERERVQSLSMKSERAQNDAEIEEHVDYTPLDQDAFNSAFNVWRYDTDESPIDRDAALKNAIQYYIYEAAQLKHEVRAILKKDDFLGVEESEALVESLAEQKREEQHCVACGSRFAVTSDTGFHCEACSRQPIPAPPTQLEEQQSITDEEQLGFMADDILSMLADHVHNCQTPLKTKLCSMTRPYFRSQPAELDPEIGARAIRATTIKDFQEAIVCDSWRVAKACLSAYGFKVKE